MVALPRLRRRRTPEATVRRLLAEVRGAPRVAVLTAAGGASPLAQALVGDRPDAGVVVLEAEAPDLHPRLAGAGPYDLVVDDTGSADGLAQRFERTFLFLRTGGTYVAAPRRDGGDLRSLRDHLTDDLPAFFRPAVGDVGREGQVVTVASRRSTLAVVREEEMNGVLAAEPRRGRLLTELPATSFASTCTVRTSSPNTGRPMKARYDVPPMSLREYHDVVCAPRSLVIQDNLLTPDTFRHNQAAELHSRALSSHLGRFAVPKKQLADATQRLDGAYFHLDNEHRGHYGHALTEQLSRLWGWREAKAREPGLKALLLVNFGRELAGWEKQLYEAAGIPRDDLVFVREPVRVERLYAATPMLSQPHYVHPRVTESWDLVGANLRAQSSGRDYPAKIFCTRQLDRRGCHNLPEVEALFAEHGFEILLPETFPLPEQAAMFHQAEVIAGFAGSGMFNVLFSDRPKHLIAIASTSYTQRNEYLIGAVRGHRLDLSFSRADLEHPVGGWSKEAVKSPFTFDLDREGVWLREILDDL